jgi:hypothetical protein
MPKTVVGLFENPGVVEEVVREIEALGFPRNEVRTLDEPANFGTTGVMGFPRLEFEVDVIRELTRIGATKAEAQAYVEGLQRGGALVFATGSDEKVEAAADEMNRRGAREIEQASGPEPGCLMQRARTCLRCAMAPSWPGGCASLAAASPFSCGDGVG